jgi:phage N-6-adenine-methyltransferase
MNAVLFSSASDEWATPQPFFDRLNAEFHFDLDTAASLGNRKCAEFLGPGGLVGDGLISEWDGVCWCNPPYSQIDRWVAKAHAESLKGATVVMLIPARTDTRYWHSYIMRASEIRLVKGRLKFGDGKNSSPFPSAVVIFRPHWKYPAPVLTAIPASIK